MRLAHKQLMEFASLIGQMDGATFLGLARILKVHSFYEDATDDQGHPLPRSGEAIVEDVLVKFDGLNRADRRKFLALARDAVHASKE